MTNPTGSWSIGNKTVQSLQIGNKEIETIERVSDGTIIYQKPQSNNLSISSTKDILSYKHSDSATITATLTDSGGSPLTSKTLSYVIKHGTTTISSGTKTTNSSGEATISYASTGVGDVNIDVSYGSLTETYTIEDCKYWNSNEVTVTTTTSTLYDSNISEALPTNCEISFDALVNNITSGRQSAIRLLPTSESDTGVRHSIGCGWSFPNSILTAGFRVANNSSSETTIYMVQSSQNTYYNFKLIKNGTSIQYLTDDTSYGSRTVSWIDDYTNYCFRIRHTGTSNITKVKNVKIKAL